MNDFNSNYKSIEYDVPRGSVLEPLLFIFINAVDFGIKKSTIFPFTNDTCFQLQVCLSMCDLFVTTRHQIFKNADL